MKAETKDDPHLWLEGVTDVAALKWVRERNDSSTRALAKDEDFKQLNERLLNIYNSDDRIPYVSKRGDYLYNFWKDAEHPQGIWRRTRIESYRTEEPAWELVLDLDALSEAEGEKWVWHGATTLPPEHRQALISLSRGGADADVTREFDLVTKTFVEDGFYLPEAKGGANWVDKDSVFVRTDFGEGSLTESGYPMQTKLWQRGQALDEATLIYEGEPEDISVGAYRDHTPNYERDIIYRNMTFYTNEVFLREGNQLLKIEKPDSAKAYLWRDWLLLELRKDWTVDGTIYKAGSLLAAPFEPWIENERNITVLFEPGERTSLHDFEPTRNHILLNTLDTVKNRIEVLTPGEKGWQREPLPGLPELGRISVTAVDETESDDYWLTVTDYLTPTTLALGSIGEGPAEQLKQLPSFFDKNGLTISQYMATSKDGTQVPYFQVAREGMKLDGSNPTLLYGYGGFEISLLPSYSATVGAAWLEKGGVFVVANIRGGGEFGPRWHQAALRDKRPRAFEDFVAVADDLVQRKVTSRKHLGARGGSNGGLLMGVMYTQYPDHFGAIVCQVPLLDMQRFHLLLAGASWVGEYGDPDVAEDWAYLKTFSPYHNIDPDEDYPPLLITTSTRDDRVHPGHARKMTAALIEAGKEILYYENIEGGHGGSANNEQAAFMEALAYHFLWKTLGK